MTTMDQFIIKHYATLGPREIAYQLGKTYRSVVSRASLLRSSGALQCSLAKSGQARPWTTPEEQWLIKNYFIGDLKPAAKHLKRTECSVKAKVRQLRRQGRLTSYKDMLKELP